MMLREFESITMHSGKRFFMEICASHSGELHGWIVDAFGNRKGNFRHISMSKVKTNNFAWFVGLELQAPFDK